MSLINRVLQHLDARSAQGLDVELHGIHVRAVMPKKHHGPMVWAVGITLVAGLFALAGGLLWQSSKAPTLAAMPILPAVPAPPPILKPDRDPSMVPLPDFWIAPLPQELAATEPVRSFEQLPEQAPERILKSPPIKEAPPVIRSAVPVVAAKVMPMPATVIEPTAASAPASPVMLEKQVRALTPQQTAENEFRRATSLIQDGQRRDAIPILEQILQRNPLHHIARQSLVGVLVALKRQDEAISLLTDGLKLDSAQPGTAMILARLQVERGEQAMAITTLQRTLPSAQERADYRSFLAALLQREGRHKDAIEHYMVALRASPQNGIWWMGLGISLQAENRSAEAFESFSTAKATHTLTPDLLAFVEQKLAQLAR